MKVILKVILERMRNKIKLEIARTQTGFIAGKGTRNAIFMLRTIIERNIDINKEIYLCFVDYSKAFDSVIHEKLIQLLKQLNIDSKDIRLIQQLYWMQSSAIRMENKVSGYVDIKKGVRQGCIMSPDLFNIYTEQIFRQTENVGGTKIGGKRYNNIRYADDTVLIAESKEELTQLINGVQQISETYGLKINTKKTMYMTVSKKNNKT